MITETTEVGASFLLGKDRIILILARAMSKVKAPTSVVELSKVEKKPKKIR